MCFFFLFITSVDYGHVILLYRFQLVCIGLLGNDWYAVCRTSSTLILCDIARGLTSEVII